MSELISAHHQLITARILYRDLSLNNFTLAVAIVAGIVVVVEVIEQKEGGSDLVC